VRRSEAATGYGSACELRELGLKTVTSDSGSNDGGQFSVGSEIPYDALGDTQLGRSLKELIKEISKEKDALKKGLASGEAPGSESQDGDDFDPSLSRFEQALELAASIQKGSENAGDGAASTDHPASAPGKSTAAGVPADGQPDAELSQAISGMEAVLQRFAEAERRRCEHKLSEWKLQLKKATMIVIKKQVDTARAKWMKNLSASQETIAEHYRRLKLLTDRVAKQKAQIQRAKKALEEKLEVADRLHNEFDEIRSVLDGQIGAIDALDKNEE
jgi:DNA repair exonuclease SbcCD ATPase subunit